jgi:Domain of unknown function (DUF4398)
MRIESPTTHRRRSLFLGATLLALAGCASGEPPTSALTQAELAIQRATEAQAGQHAPVELSRAQNRLTEAKIANQDRDYDEARRLAEQAESDAELARARATAVATEQNAEQIRSTTEQIREDMQPAAGPLGPAPTSLTPAGAIPPAAVR